jgi:hypothetical protein
LVIVGLVIVGFTFIGLGVIGVVDLLFVGFVVGIAGQRMIKDGMIGNRGDVRPKLVSDQGKVWDEVARQQSALGTSSPSSAMADTFQAYGGRVAEFREKLRYVDGASGLAVAVGKKIVAVDLFDKVATCRKVWERLLTGYVLDALEAEAEQGQAETADVERLLETANALSWQKADPVGEGEEYRAQQGQDVHASALTLRDAPVHVSLVVAG